MAEISNPDPARTVHRWHWSRILLVIPFVAMLWVPLYNRIEPKLWSFPFFYWYQLLWILLTVVVVYAVYLVEHRARR
ncbi:MAG: DUF3311 domain-containing protein [Pseudomonadota bacterium]|nr:DUF3311 domain-containing protein [Pseudomonadota bacterium]